MEKFNERGIKKKVNNINITVCRCNLLCVYKIFYYSILILCHFLTLINFTQKVKTIPNLKSTFLVSRRESKTLTEKFTEWFRKFLENSE